MSARAQPARGYRLKPAARRGARGRAASRIRWDRLGRIVLLIVLVGVLASYVRPALNLYETWRDARTERTTLSHLQAQHQRLAERANGITEPQARERAARRLGLVVNGERAYVVRGLSGN